MSPSGSPILYPEITFAEPGGNITYQVKFSQLSQFILDEEGVDPREMPEIMRSPRPGKVALFYKLFAAGVAHHFVAARQPIPTAAEWVTRCEAAGIRFQQIIEVVLAATKKAPSPAEAGQPAQDDAPAASGAPN